MVPAKSRLGTDDSFERISQFDVQLHDGLFFADWVRVPSGEFVRITMWDLVFWHGLALLDFFPTTSLKSFTSGSATAMCRPSGGSTGKGILVTFRPVSLQ